MPKTEKCLLTIDDDHDLCEIIRERFELLGYKVLIAHDGAEGFRKTEESRPDCVILDIVIPKGEDGLTYLRKLRAYSHKDPQQQTHIRGTPVIVLTGTGTERQAAFEFEGISGFLEKPFNLVNLQGKIEQALRTR